MNIVYELEPVKKPKAEPKDRDHVLAFALLITHGGFYHKKWLIKAAYNYIEGKDIHDNNEDTPNCP